MKLGRKPKRILTAIAIVVVSTSLSRLLNWPTPVRLSPTTTYVTSPLAEDGLPNFTQAMLDREREGVTLENNGARLFWQAIGPSEIGLESFQTICDDLQIKIDDAQPFLISPHDKELTEQVSQWLAAQTTEPEANEEDAELQDSPEPLDAAAEVITGAQSRPWTADQVPLLAEWVAANQAPLDLLVEASRQPLFFSPPPNARDPQTTGISLLLPHAHGARTAVRALATRAMNRLAQGDPAAAWNDVFACWRFGQHIGHGPTLIELLVGVATRSAARDATLPILDSPNLTREAAEQILVDLQSLDPQLDLVEHINFGERLMMLDLSLRMTTGRLGGTGDPDDQLEDPSAIDPNVALEMTNVLYDRMAKAIGINDWKVRETAIDQIYDEIDQMSQMPKSNRIRAFFSRKIRSEAVGSIMLSLMAPALKAVVDAQERDQASLTLTQIATALAIYRIDHGEYPAALAELETDGILQPVPNDPFTNAPFRYERRGEGYLLYSLLQNRTDDGGSDVSHPIVNGEWLSEEEAPNSEHSHGDLVIRLPLPPLELPPQAADENAEP